MQITTEVAFYACINVGIVSFFVGALVGYKMGKKDAELEYKTSLYLIKRIKEEERKASEAENENT